MEKSTTKEIIKRFKNKHGNLYDYSKVKYDGTHVNVNIICEKHGGFYQPPHSHLRGNGCPKCGILSGVNLQKITTEEFVKKVKLIHNNRYDYSKVCYNGYQTKIKIICKEHGEFLQRPSVHLRGNGCSKCSRILSSNIQKCTDINFITKSNKVHNNRYNYSKIEYKNAHIKIEIICPSHGSFFQTPSSHVRGNGCPTCKSSKGELQINEYLIKNNIKFITQHKFNDCLNPKTKWKLEFDFYIPGYNICIEYDGLQHYEPIHFFGGEKSFVRNKTIDRIKTKYCKINEIKLIRIPYWEQKNIDKILEKEIKYNQKVHSGNLVF